MTTLVNLSPLDFATGGSFSTRPPVVNITSNVPNISSMTFLSITGHTSTSLTLNFSMPVFLSGPALSAANWIVAGGGVPVQVTAVGAPSGSTVTLTISEQTQGASYTLQLPFGISGQSGLTFVALSGNLFVNFTGIGNPPTIVIAFPENDAFKVDVIFSEAVVDTEALIAANYSINNGLQVFSVDKLSSSSYRLHTSQQTAGVTYTLTVSNIHDLKGNLI